MVALLEDTMGYIIRSTTEKKRTKPFVENFPTEKADFSKLNIIFLVIANV